MAPGGATLGSSYGSPVGSDKQFLPGNRDKVLEPPWVFLCSQGARPKMSYVVKPAGSPGCWGVKYQDGDLECGQCKYKDTCREALLHRVVNPQAARTNLPVLSNYNPRIPAPPPPPSVSNYASTQTAVAPLPSRPYFAPPVSSLPVPAKTVPPLPTSAPQATTPQVTTAQNQYYQQSTGWSLPNTSNPNPLAPMFRPGAPSPAYYFTQYPGESVVSRVGKNILLRAAEAIFGELMQFFRHWSWPPR